jgi:uncharacterized protein (DUF1501 family)
MAGTHKDPVLVVLQLSGGNDYLNTVIPYNNPLYRDNRPTVGIPDDQILHLDNNYGFHPAMAPLKKIWDEGKLAIMHGVGYANSPRSHFRSMDIWHTCEPDKVGTEGWLGRVAREFDPRKENVVTTVSFGPSLFRALSVQGVPVACVAGPLERYGFLPTACTSFGSLPMDCVQVSTCRPALPRARTGTRNPHCGLWPRCK